MRIVGDVDYESAKRVASYITPVPGTIFVIGGSGRGRAIKELI